MIMDRRAEPKYQIGQLVRHVRYGYRGVVVELDLACAADDAWYRNNRTQPKREQPWYHVLVHDASNSTYAAETNLEADPSEEEINHPLIDRFFYRFENGFYVRNDQPWGMI